MIRAKEKEEQKKVIEISDVSLCESFVKALGRKPSLGREISKRYLD